MGMRSNRLLRRMGLNHEIGESWRVLFFGQRGVGIFTRGIRHLVTGGIGTAVYMAGVVALVEVFRLDPVVSAALSYLFLEVFTYLAYRYWVYNTTRSHLTSITRYIVTSVVALLLNVGVMYVAVDVLELKYAWGLVLGAFIIPPTNFFLNYAWAFR